jgi:hypothetical protein
MITTGIMSITATGKVNEDIGDITIIVIPLSMQGR